MNQNIKERTKQSTNQNKATLEAKVVELQAQVEQYKEIARQHTQLASKGIYYTLDELVRHDGEVKALAEAEILALRAELQTAHDWVASVANTSPAMQGLVRQSAKSFLFVHGKAKEQK